MGSKADEDVGRLEEPIGMAVGCAGLGGRVGRHI